MSVTTSFICGIRLHSLGRRFNNGSVVKSVWLPGTSAQSGLGFGLGGIEKDTLVSRRNETFMKTTKALFGILSITAALATHGYSQTFPTLTIPATGFHIQSQPLQNGVLYLIEASGTYFWDYSGGSNNISDAAFGISDAVPTWRPNPTGGLWIDGKTVNWLGTTNGIDFFTNTFSPSHVYAYYTAGANQPLDFFVADSTYGDNAGSLQVSIVAVPTVNLIKAVKPSFSRLSIGTNYQLQVSANLNNWTNQGSAFTATNTSMVYPQYWDVDNWNSLFFRLQVAP